MSKRKRAVAVKVFFKMSGGERIDDTLVDKVLREAFINKRKMTILRH